MRKIYIIRHGETDWNRLHLFQGQSDIPLNANGRLQAAALAERLRDVLPFDRIVSSDLARAADTAAYLCCGQGQPVLTDPGFREVHFGAWEGKPAEEIEKRWPGELQRWFDSGELNAPGGEPLAVFHARVWDCFRHWARQSDYEKMAILTHGGTCRALMSAILERPPQEMRRFILRNTEMMVVDVDESDRCFLDEEGCL